MCNAIPQFEPRPRASLVIVDDNQSFGASLASYLRQHGYAAIAYTSGLQALTYLRDHPVDLVITDLYMPEFDGIELMRACRSLHLSPLMLVMTGGLPDILPVVRVLGAAGTLLKPFEPARLLKILDELLVSPELIA